MSRRLVVLASVLVAVSLGAAACGSSSSDSAPATTTTASSAVSWATAVCTAFGTWKSSVAMSANSVKQTPTKATVQTAVEQAKADTRKLVATLDGQGAPRTSAGTTAQATLTQLASQLQTGLTTIEQALSGASGAAGWAAAAVSVKNDVQMMSTHLKEAKSSLQALPHGELKDAFAGAPGCGGSEAA